MLLFQCEGIEQESKDELLILYKELPAKVDEFESAEIFKITEFSNDFDLVLDLQFSSKDAF